MKAANTKIPASTVNRLTLYLRGFSQVEKTGQETVSSKDIEQFSGIKSAQVRKDLAYFGQFGRRGVGYPVIDLKSQIRSILGLDKDWKVAIIGVGRLGTALMMYQGFGGLRFKVVAAFDNDPEKIDWELEGTRVHPLSDFGKVAAKAGVEIAILTVPGDTAQEAADSVAQAGVPAILNFAPERLSLPKNMLVRDVNLASEIEALTFQLHKS